MGKSAAFTLVVHQAAMDELGALRPFERMQVNDAIEANLLFEPLKATRKRKFLGDIKAGFAYQPPLWELKIGEIRVAYTVHEQTRTVSILAVRRKPPHSTTEEVLR